MFSWSAVPDLDRTHALRPGEDGLDETAREAFGVVGERREVNRL